jgi:hypothetical protein
MKTLTRRFFPAVMATLVGLLLMPLQLKSLLIRGGNWGETGAHCRSAMRGYSDASAKHYGIGFRLVLAPQLP